MPCHRASRPCLRYDIAHPMIWTPICHLALVVGLLVFGSGDIVVFEGLILLEVKPEALVTGCGLPLFSARPSWTPSSCLLARNVKFP